jgi:hypothetical protein
MEYKVKDYPDLLKREGGVINKNNDDYLRAKSRLKQSKRIDTLENEVRGLHSKIDTLIELLNNAKSK